MRTSLTFNDGNLRSLLEANGLARYDDFITCTQGEIVGRTSGSQTRRLTLANRTEPVELFLKVYDHTRNRGRWRIQGNKVETEVRNYHLMTRAGVSVPHVVCHGHRSGILRLLNAFILTRGIPHSLALDVFVSQRWPRPGMDDPLRRELLARSVTMVRRMHTAGFFHIDLQWRNILVSLQNPAAPELFVIDSTRGGFRAPGIRREHARLRDLSSLAKEAASRLSRAERLRWLRQYLGGPRLTVEHRQLIHTIERDRVLKDNGSKA